jgi:L-alanine-DL-glutamate epimerase-like enolase superfamily enzyme
VAAPPTGKGKERGYENFDVKVAPDGKFDLEMCRLVRKLAPKGFLRADANGGYDVDTSLEMAPKLAEAGVDVLEGPLHPNRISGYQRLVRQGALPILMDEGCASPVEVEESISLKCIDGIATKPAALNGPQFLGASVLKEPFKVERGRIRIPKGPDLGIEVDEDKVRELSARTG